MAFLELFDYVLYIYISSPLVLDSSPRLPAHGKMRQSAAVTAA